ncbi:MAG TPA: hypothetical protein VMM56_14140, partial [Planctomycetaceae bacterium]|nr:hypothetical protein [Planctomycetaceae bacterium]
MIDRELNIQLSRVARRVRSYRLWSGLGFAFILAAVLCGTLYLMNRSAGEAANSSLKLVLTVSAIGTLLAIFVAWRSGRNAVRLARQIEARFPELNSSLLTAIEQEPQTSTGRFGYLQQNVIDKAMLHARVYGWHNLISRERMIFSRISAIGGFVLLVLWTQGLVSLPSADPGKSAEQMVSFDKAVVDGGEYVVSIEPGDTEIERGTSLLVRAKFEDRLPLDATIVYKMEDGEERTLAMK